MFLCTSDVIMPFWMIILYIFRKKILENVKVCSINLFYKKKKNYQKMQNKIEWHISGLKNYWVKYILNGRYYHDNYYVKVLNGSVKHWIIYNSFFSKIRWKANLKWKAHPQFWELWHPIYLKFSVWSMQLLCESAK